MRQVNRLNKITKFDTRTNVYLLVVMASFLLSPLSIFLHRIPGKMQNLSVWHK